MGKFHFTSGLPDNSQSASARLFHIERSEIFHEYGVRLLTESVIHASTNHHCICKCFFQRCVPLTRNMMCAAARDVWLHQVMCASRVSGTHHITVTAGSIITFAACGKNITCADGANITFPLPGASFLRTVEITILFRYNYAIWQNCTRHFSNLLYINNSFRMVKCHKLKLRNPLALVNHQ